MTYSVDFRRKALELREKENLSMRTLARRFGVSLGSVLRWTKKPEPARKRNKPATKIDMERLKADIEMYPDAYQHERASRFGVTKTGIQLALKRLKVTYKKNADPSQKGRQGTYLLPEKDRTLC